MNKLDDTMSALRALRRGIDLSVADLACEANPLLPGYGEALSLILRTRADTLWLRVRHVFHDIDECSALRQAWSIWPGGGTWTGLLYCAGASGSAALQREARRLRGLTARWKSPEQIPAHVRSADPLSAFGLWLLADQPADALPLPELGPISGVRGSGRLRFNLARRIASRESLASIFSRAAWQPGPSHGSRRAEFMRALHAMQAQGREKVRLTETDIVRLDGRELDFLRQLQPVWPEFVVASLHRNPDPAAALKALLDQRDHVTQCIREIAEAARLRNFATIDRVVSSLPRQPVVDAIARMRAGWIGVDTADDWGHPILQPEWGPWQPLSIPTAQRLLEWRERPLPPVWTMTPAQVAESALRGELRDVRGRPAISCQDLAAIRRAWRPHQQLALIRAGAGMFVDAASPVWNELTLSELAAAAQRLGTVGAGLLGDRLRALPDARPWLELMAQGDAAGLREQAALALTFGHSLGLSIEPWEQFSSTAIGTPQWEAVRSDAMRGTRLLRQLIVMRNSGKAPVDAPAQRRAVAVVLHDDTVGGRYRTRTCLAWIARDPEALPVLIEQGPARLLMRIAVHRATPVTVLNQLTRLATPAVQRAAERAIVRRQSKGA